MAITSEEKLNEKLLKGIEKGMTVEEYSRIVNTVLSYNQVSSVENLVSDYQIVMGEMQKKGYDIVEVTNTFALNGAYRAVITILNKDDYAFELQYHTRQSLDISEINNQLYEEHSKPETTTERKKDLEALMAAIVLQIETPKNIDSVESCVNAEWRRHNESLLEDAGW